MPNYLKHFVYIKTVYLIKHCKIFGNRSYFYYRHELQTSLHQTCLKYVQWFRFHALDTSGRFDQGKRRRSQILCPFGAPRGLPL